MNDTPTPRTDACERGFTADTSQHPQYRLTELCRQLERELAEAKEQNEVWKNEAELLRGELAKADSALQSNIDTFLDLKQQRDRLADALRKCRGHMRHGLNCHARIPEQGFRCDCGCDKAAISADEALAAVEGGDDE